MIGAALVELFVRMLVSLGFTLALIAVCYFGVKKYSSRTGVVASTGFSGRRLQSSSMPKQARKEGVQQSGMTLLARTNLSRSTSLVAVQFGQNVFLVASSETAPATVLAQEPLSTWQGTDLFDGDTPGKRFGVSRVPLVSRSAVDAVSREDGSLLDTPSGTESVHVRRSWLDVAREATVRQG